MGNVLIPFHGWGLRTWNVDKTLLIWKTLSLSACIVGTAVYCSPLESYLEHPCFGILVPTFLTGYIIINSSDIFVLFAHKEYIFLEICLAAIGAVGSMICGIYELYKWILWVIDTFSDRDADHNFSEFVLMITLIVNSVSMFAVVVHRSIQQRSSSNENQ